MLREDNQCLLDFCKAREIRVLCEKDPGVSYPSIRRGNAPVSQFADPDDRGRPIRIVRVKNVQVGNYMRALMSSLLLPSRVEPRIQRLCSPWLRGVFVYTK